LPDLLTFLLTNMRQRYNEAPKKPNFIFQVTDLQQEKIIIEKSGENRKVNKNAVKQHDRVFLCPISSVDKRLSLPPQD
ncbi:MAG: hypothetical protein IKZ56_01610, partial [Bacteroidales bacterium]|nr:hypothetical protein [Bacteroidales bacterium]